MKIIVNRFVSVIKNESGDYSEQDNSVDLWNIENEWGRDRQSSRTEAMAKESAGLLWKTTASPVAKPREREGIHVKVFIQDKCPESRRQIIFEKPQNS